MSVSTQPALNSKRASRASAKAAPVTSSKGQLTREAILNAAVSLAGQHGLSGLTIGALAEAAKMSRSGVFVHFGSKEDLQIATVAHYHQRFTQAVFAPAMAAAKGLPRLYTLFYSWIEFASAAAQTGCIFISGATEFDDKPGAVRDAIAASVEMWLDAMQRTIEMAQELGHLRPQTDARDLLLLLHGLILTLHFDSRFLRADDAQTRIERIFRATMETQLSEAGRALHAQELTQLYQNRA